MAIKIPMIDIFFDGSDLNAFVDGRPMEDYYKKVKVQHFGPVIPPEREDEWDEVNIQRLNHDWKYGNLKERNKFYDDIDPARLKKV